MSLVAETGTALARIVGQVGQINATITEIAASAQEQATGLHQVNTAVNEMDQVTQQNAAMVEQSTAASHALSHEAGELARLAGRFRLGEAASARPPARPAAPAPRNTGNGGNVAPLHRPARAGRAAIPAPASRTSAARKPAPDLDEGWGDF